MIEDSGRCDWIWDLGKDGVYGQDIILGITSRVTGAS